MKKSLLALAVLGAYAGVASAQSSVTLYGTIDLSGKYIKNDGSSKRLSLSRDGINSSQLGFRGVEDLGGGLKAGFNLLASVGADSGDIGGGQTGSAVTGGTGAATATSTTGSGKFWSRRSTVSLFSNAGELRLGRDYTPTFWNNTIFDAFGTNGLGDSSHVLQMATSTFVRADNAVQYFLPANIGGFYGQATVAAGEGGATGVLGGTGPEVGQTSNGGRYVGGRVGFAAGPFDVAIAAAQQRNGPALGVKQNTYNLGGAYDFGFLKLMGYIDRDTATARRETRGSISAVVPMGQGEIHVGYDRSKFKNSVVPAASFDNSVWQVKATYQYNLSKRTAMYGTIAELSNGNSSRLSISNQVTAQTAAPTLGGKSKGFELGVRHFF
jgi:predicted porin